MKRRYAVTDRGWEFFDDDDERLVFLTWLPWGAAITTMCAKYDVHSIEELAPYMDRDVL